MEVKRGYKQTEVGVIPEDWETRQLQQISDSDFPICYGIVQVGSFAPNGVPVLAIKNLNLDYSNNIHRASAATERPYTRSRVRPNDVLVSVKGTTGRVGIVPSHFHGNISRDLARIRPRAEVAPRFVYQMLQSDLEQRRLTNATVGTTRMELSITILKQFSISLPPTLAEQEAIAGALSDADALIESLERILAKKRQIKQGAMQELLTGKKRLPVFEAKLGYKQTEAGTIPTDWIPATLGDMTTKVGSGITPTGGSRVYKDDGRPFLRSQNVGWGALLLDDIAFIDEETHGRFRDTEIELDDVFLNITGASIGRSAVADSRVEHGNVNQHVCIIRTDPDRLHPMFLNYFLLSTAGQRQIDSFQAGGNRQGLNFGQVRSFRLPFPPTLAEQTAIASVLSDMDTEIGALETKLVKARQVKQGMMQELLTGRIRLV